MQSLPELYYQVPREHVFLQVLHVNKALQRVRVILGFMPTDVNVTDYTDSFEL